MLRLSLVTAALLALLLVDRCAASETDNDTVRYPGPAGYRVVISIESPKGKSGTVELRSRPELAPTGAWQFWRLVRSGFYDGACFFRVIPGFMAQVGIPPDPKRSEGWEEPVKDDDMGKGSNDRGFVSFATRGPNTRTYQIFFNTVANRFLDHQGFTPFAEVVSGMDVIDALFVTGEGAPQGAGPSQGRLAQKGNAYLKEGWPDVSCIREAVVLTEPPEHSEPPSAPGSDSQQTGQEDPNAKRPAVTDRVDEQGAKKGVASGAADIHGIDQEPERLAFVTAEEQAHASRFSFIAFLVVTFAVLFICVRVRQVTGSESRDLEA
jgi:peptidyl-prolyl cis-trans isomerase A (cyclophilin A)